MSIHPPPNACKTALLNLDTAITSKKWFIPTNAINKAINEVKATFQKASESGNLSQVDLTALRNKITELSKSSLPPARGDKMRTIFSFIFGKPPERQTLGAHSTLGIKLYGLADDLTAQTESLNAQPTQTSSTTAHSTAQRNKNPSSSTRHIPKDSTPISEAFAGDDAKTKAAAAAEEKQQQASLLKQQEKVQEAALKQSNLQCYAVLETGKIDSNTTKEIVEKIQNYSEKDKLLICKTFAAFKKTETPATIANLLEIIHKLHPDGTTTSTVFFQLEKIRSTNPLKSPDYKTPMEPVTKQVASEIKAGMNHLSIVTLISNADTEAKNPSTKTELTQTPPLTPPPSPSTTPTPEKANNKIQITLDILTKSPIPPSIATEILTIIEQSPNGEQLAETHCKNIALLVKTGMNKESILNIARAIIAPDYAFETVDYKAAAPLIKSGMSPKTIKSIVLAVHNLPTAPKELKKNICEVVAPLINGNPTHDSTIESILTLFVNIPDQQTRQVVSNAVAAKITPETSLDDIPELIVDSQPKETENSIEINWDSFKLSELQTITPPEKATKPDEILIGKLNTLITLAKTSKQLKSPEKFFTPPTSTNPLSDADITKQYRAIRFLTHPDKSSEKPWQSQAEILFTFNQAMYDAVKQTRNM